MSFVHLHVHSCFSLLDGAIKIDDLVSSAKSMNMPAVALTDHGQMFGILPFYSAAMKAGLNPVLGVETYVAAKGRKNREPGDVRNHLTLLAKDMDGYRNLCRLVSRANIEGFYHKPRVDHELLAQYSQGIIALSGCIKGEVPYNFLKGRPEESEAAAKRYLEIFDGRFYLEVQENGLDDQNEANKWLRDLGQRLGIGLVATNDCHYLKKDHYEVHDVLLCIQTGKTVDEEKRMRFMTRECYFKSPQEMAAAFHYLPEALANTVDIAAQCQVRFPDKPTYAFPALKLADGESKEDKMAVLAREGLEQRFINREAVKPFTDEEKAAYRERLEMEIGLINQMGFPGYFLIVADFIGWAKKQGIPVGPGRGSAAGSLVAYALLITDIDPIRYDLLFERFLNPERISMPDIDVDFCTDGREEVIKYVTSAYGGKEQVSQIITFGQMKAKAVIRDVGRALGLAYGEVDKIAKLVPNQLNITLDEALSKEPLLKAAVQSDPRVEQLIEYARVLENLPRHASTHAAGVVIGDKPLMEHLPLYCDPATPDGEDGEKTQVITQFDMKWVESIGLIKFDFLGLKTLTLIDQCLKLLKQRNISLNLDHIDFEDPPTYQLLSRGDTTGVFQLESSGMREILMKLRPTCIDDLMALVALYRPGPLKSGMVEVFIDGKHGRRPVVYELPQLEPILKETYGVILYQEQVMRISQELANYSLGEADLLRRAMGKKKPEEMAEQKTRFMSGAEENKIEKQKADHIFELMANFAEYGFNKSHSAAYAVVAYQTAFLKANYPVEFMAALLSSEKDNQDKVVRLMGECRAGGIMVLPPDVNDSGYKFTVVDGAVRFGLGAIKGVGQAAIDSIIAAREEGPFKNLYDFCERVDTQKVNRRVIEALIKCGAFDKSGGADRAPMLAALDEALESGARAQKDRREGQLNMFDMLAEAAPETAPPIRWPAVPPLKENMRLAYEKEALGFFITGHPLARYDLELNVVTSCTADGAKEKPDKSEVRLGGVIEKITTKIDKKGKRFAYITLEDLTGSIELLLWSDVYESAAEIIKPENVVLVSGVVDAGEWAGQANVKVVVREISLLDDALAQRARSIIFKVPLAGLTTETNAFLEEAAINFKGPTNAYILLEEDSGEAVYKLAHGLTACRDLIELAHQKLGRRSLEIR